MPIPQTNEQAKAVYKRTNGQSKLTNERTKAHLGYHRTRTDGTPVVRTVYTEGSISRTQVDLCAVKQKSVFSFLFY